LKARVTDQAIIQEILNGNRDSFRMLYEKYKRRFMLTCQRYMKTHGDAEDALQDAFIHIFKDLKSYDSAKSQFHTWSNRIVVNTCLQKLRKKSVLNVFDDIREMSNTLSIDASAIGKLNLQEMTGLIKKMPKGYRTVFNLYVIEGFSHKEIAAQMKIQESTSRSQLVKARKMLQSKITKLMRIVA